jgi:hypothetical protein
MNTASWNAKTSLERGALSYMLVCLCALLVLYQVLDERGLDQWSLVPVVVGAAGVFLRWSASPVALIGAVVLALMAEGNYLLLESRETLRIPDFLLCAGVLAYVMAHYRLTALAEPFPVERPPRKQQATPAPAPVQRERPEALFISGQEMGLLLLALPVWAGLAQLAWQVLPTSWANPGVLGPVWRAMLFFWIVGGLALVTASALDYWRRRTMSLEEANLFLQDTLWQETRREQRRINRWFAWARVRQPWSFRWLFRRTVKWGTVLAYGVMLILGILVFGIYLLLFLARG